MAADEPVRVLVVAEDPYVRSGVVAELAGSGQLIVSAAATLDEPAATDAEVILLDLGADLPGDLALGDVGVPVLVLAADPSLARRALAAGAAGAIDRGSDAERITAALLAVRAGLVVQEPTDTPPRAEPPPGPALLTAREAEVLDLLARGLSNPEIAEALGITRHTAKFHVKAILDKLGAESRTEAVVLAARSGLVHL